MGLERLCTGSSVQVLRTAQMFVLGLSVFCCPVQVEALLRADHSAREPYRVLEH
jgi:hypothetical protein